MTKRRLKTALYAAGAVTLALSVTTASFAQFQRNQTRQNQQSANPLGDLIGMIAQASAKSKAKKRWAQIGPEIQQCVNTYLESRNITVQQMMAEGLSPDHEKVTPIVTMCQSVMTTQLKANFPCNVTNAKGQEVPSTCSQSYVKSANGKWMPISRDDFLRAGSNNETVNIADFETQAAQNARLAGERRQLAEERRIAQEAKAREEAARRERLAREEEERRRFAASPEGKRQAAERAARERRAAEEARRRPRGYVVACSGTSNSQLNSYFVNCDNPASVRDGFRWAYRRLLTERGNGRVFADGCLENLGRYSDIPASVATNRQIINSLLAACNVGLQAVQGPSAADAAARKR